METKSDESDSNALDPKIVALLSKIPNEPSVEKFKQWLIDNEVRSCQQILFRQNRFIISFYLV